MKRHMLVCVLGLGASCVGASGGEPVGSYDEWAAQQKAQRLVREREARETAAAEAAEEEFWRKDETSGQTAQWQDVLAASARSPDGETSKERVARHRRERGAPALGVPADGTGVAAALAGLVELAEDQERGQRARARYPELALVEAPHYVAAYADNEVRADLAYREKRFLLRGAVTEFASLDDGTPALALRGGVVCYFPTRLAQNVAALDKGDMVVVECMGMGKPDRYDWLPLVCAAVVQ